MKTLRDDRPSLPATLITRLSRSNLAAQLSEQTAMAAVPIVAVVTLNASAQQSAALQTLATLPFLLLSLPAGLLADRVGRKPLMVAAELARALALFGLSAMLYAQALPLTALGALGFVIATGTVVYSVAAPALVAALVVREQLLAANRQLEIARSLAYTAGPPIGGALAGWFGGPFAFVTALGLSLISVGFLARLPADAHRATPDRRLLRELADGVNFIVRHSHLRPIVATSFVYNLSWTLLLAIFAYYAIHQLSFSAAAVGIALGCYGGGMIVGALLYPRLTRRLHFGRQILLGPVSAAIAALLMASTLATHSGLAVFPAFFLFGCGPVIWTIATTSLRQVVTPDTLIARASAVILTVTFGARPLGALLAAGLSARFGVASCLIAAGVGFLLQLAIIVFAAPSRLSALPETAP